jgi:IS5 family transposase
MVTRGRKLRIDSTVVAAAIHYPTDSTLLADGVRVLSRLVQRATAALTGRPRRIGLRRIRHAKHLVRRIEASAALHATPTDRAERPGRYRQLLAIAQASLDQAERMHHTLAKRSEAALRRVDSALCGLAPLVRQVIVQTQRRVLQGQSVPAAAKVVSLFEPHTAILRRGKAHVPAEFGRKVLLDEVDGGLITRYAVLVGNPPDAPELPTSLAHHQVCFGQPPAVLTADRAFFTLDNDRLAAALRIRSVAVPRQGPLTVDQRRWRDRAAFRRAYRWRAGIEGRISLLKRRFGLNRCRYHGDAGVERWVGWAVLAHNLRQISRAVACHDRD